MVLECKKGTEREHEDLVQTIFWHRVWLDFAGFIKIKVAKAQGG